MSVLLKAMKRAATEKGRKEGEEPVSFKETRARPVYHSGGNGGGWLGLLLAILVMAGVFAGALAIMSGAFEGRGKNEAAGLNPPEVALLSPPKREVVAAVAPVPESLPAAATPVEAVAPPQTDVDIASEAPAPEVVIEPLLVADLEAPKPPASFIFVHPLVPEDKAAAKPEAKPVPPVKEKPAVPVVVKEEPAAPVAEAKPEAEPVSPVKKKPAALVLAEEVPAAPAAEKPHEPVAEQKPEPAAAEKVAEQVKLPLLPVGLAAGLESLVLKPWSVPRLSEKLPTDAQARLSWASDLIRKGDVPQALTIYDGLRADYPDRVEIDVAQILTLRRFSPDVPEIAVISARLEEAARDIAAGIAARRARDEDKAAASGIILLRRIMDAHLQAEVVASQAGCILVMADDADDGFALLEKAARLAPEKAVHAYNLGVALEKSGRGKDAAPQFRRALELGGKTPPFSREDVGKWLDVSGK